MTDSFPRQQARTRNFSLGVPRSFRVSPDGRRVVFLRSRGGADPVTCLWVLDLPGAERLVADPAELGAADATEPATERARRERSREVAGGVVAFSTDASFSTAAFAVAGQVYAVGLGPEGPRPRQVNAGFPAIDPRLDPTGRRIAYVCDGALRVADLVSGEDAELIGPGDTEDLTYGLAEFIAAEEMGRQRGFWWGPDGSALLAARVDNSPVRRWYIADPANPDQSPTPVRYPAAGTPNASVSLLVVRLDGGTVPVRWDAAGFPYVTAVEWDLADPLIVVQSRDQSEMRLLEVGAATGDTTVLRADSGRPWLDIVPGVPDVLADGRIVWTADADGARRLLVAEPEELSRASAEPVTPADLHLREVLAVDGDTVLFSASGEDPARIDVWSSGPAGLARMTAEAGVHGAVRAGGTAVLSSRSLAAPGVTTTVLRDRGDGQLAPVATIGSLAERPALPGVRLELLRAGQRELSAALVLPSWHKRGSARLPVLMDPYGGPHGQRVLAAAGAYLTSQWFADQGFAVIVADGRGTPGRGLDWERAVAGDLASLALEDQADAIAAIAARYPDDLDPARVAIRGWSFGGFLAALAVLRMPDVFHAAVAGAPVTDLRLYDTHYTERYLGHPEVHPAAYERSSLIADAPKLARPLLLIHGLADDNVFVAHTLRLSSALLAAGRPHQVLPLTGVTHLAAQEEVAENLLLLQVEFLRSALGLGAATGGAGPAMS
jgi:dipeptidyl-peptidase 4